MNKYLNLNKSFINGEWVDGNEGKSVDLVNPYNDDVVAKVELASINQVNEAFTGARNVQKSWGHDSENRKAVMKQAVEYFKNNKEAIMERSEEHTSELQSRGHLVCRLLLEKKNKIQSNRI